MSTKTIELVIRPGPRNPTTKSREGRYSAVWGERVVVTAKEPFFAAARILVAEGFDPNTVLTMRHDGSQTRSLTMPLGKAAGLMVEENDDGLRIRRWKAHPLRGGSSLIPQNAEALPECTSENNEPTLAPAAAK
jgi:hypothetical protein